MRVKGVAQRAFAAAGVLALIRLGPAAWLQAPLESRLRGAPAVDAGPRCVRCRADFFSERRGFIDKRPLPPNAEMLGSEVRYLVKLSKPLGIEIINHPDGVGYGVGIQSIQEGGSAHSHNERVLREGAEPEMWVQEGDRLVAVNEEEIETKDDAARVVGEAQGEMELIFSRQKLGAVQVIFPNGKRMTANAKGNLMQIALNAGYDCGCRCKNGRCGKCWHADPATGEIYMLPINCPGLIPSVFRRREEGGGKEEYDSWVPLRLVPAPEAFKRQQELEAQN